MAHLTTLHDSVCTTPFARLLNVAGNTNVADHVYRCKVYRCTVTTTSNNGAWWSACYCTRVREGKGAADAPPVLQAANTVRAYALQLVVASEDLSENPV